MEFSISKGQRAELFVVLMHFCLLVWNCSVVYRGRRWQHRMCVWSPNSSACSEVSLTFYLTAILQYCLYTLKNHLVLNEHKLVLNHTPALWLILANFRVTTCLENLEMSGKRSFQGKVAHTGTQY